MKRGNILTAYLDDLGRHKLPIGTPLPADRNDRVTSNLALVVPIARRFQNRGVPLEDLIQVGNLGLIRAAELFDPARQIKFSTYATHWIIQGMIRAIRDHGALVRLPYYIRDRLSKWYQTDEAQRLPAGTVPTERTIVRALGISPRSARPLRDAIALIAAHGVAPTAGRVDNDCDALDGVADEGGDPGEVSAAAERITRLRRALASLPAREREILTRRFGLDGRPPETLKEVGDSRGQTREWIRQVQESGLRLLRLELERLERQEVA